MLVHEQLTLPEGVEVDAGVADLLAALWELGLQTSHSCQGTPAGPFKEDRDGSAAYVLFPRAIDAFSFFSQTLAAISSPESMAQIVVNVRLLTRAGTPGWRSRKRGTVVSLEIGVKPGGKERDLCGCVRFDPELMPAIEAAFVAERATSP